MPVSSDSTATPHRASAQLIVPFAISAEPGGLAALQALPAPGLRHLNLLLQGMRRLRIDLQDAHTLSPPHERAFAAAQGLADTPDGLLAWAAQEAAEHGLDAGKGWAWLTPCHWAMGREHATLSDPSTLDLHESESRALFGAMAPYFEADGIRLHFASPGRWLAEGDLFRQLPTASLDRVLGRDVDAWLPRDAADTAPGAARLVKRLQNEMQMLLYTHQVNDARAAHRKLPVNSFWLSGSGALPDGVPAGQYGQVAQTRKLAAPFLANDWTAWAASWQALDAGEVAALLARQRAGETVRITLAGERGFESLESQAAGWTGKTVNWLQNKGVLAIKPFWNGREQL